MAIAFNSAAGRYVGTAAAGTLSLTTGGANTFLVVSIKVAATFTCSGVTYAGSTMTQIFTGTTPTVATRVYQFGLSNPTTGANNIIATFSGSNAFAMSGAQYTGVKQGTIPTGVVVSETASGTSVGTANVTLNGSWLIGGALITEDVNADSVYLGTLRTSIKQTDVIDSNGYYGIGDHTMGYVWPSSDRHAYGVFALPPASPPSSGIIGGII